MNEIPANNWHDKDECECQDCLTERQRRRDLRAAERVQEADDARWRAAQQAQRSNTASGQALRIIAAFGLTGMTVESLSITDDRVQAISLTAQNIGLSQLAYLEALRALIDRAESGLDQLDDLQPPRPDAYLAFLAATVDDRARTLQVQSQSLREILEVLGPRVADAFGWRYVRP